MNTHIVHGPQGCGKSHNLAEIATKLQADMVVEEWAPDDGLLPGALHLTNATPEALAPFSDQAQVLGFTEVMAQ
jgi:hypothetical protein